MKLSDKLIYPVKIKNLQFNETTEHFGITYKEALVLALAGNSKMIQFQSQAASKEINRIYDSEDCAERIEIFADAIIKQLEEE